MKTIKSILLGAAAFVSATASASYVYSWQLVDDWPSYDYAIIAAYGDSGLAGYLYASDEGGATKGSATAMFSDASGASRFYKAESEEAAAFGSADVTYLMGSADRDSYTYIVEMWNGSGKVWDSVTYTYDSLIAGYEYLSGVADPSTISVARVSVTIPEPAGALLLLLGMGLLALKRKRG